MGVAFTPDDERGATTVGRVDDAPQFLVVLEEGVGLVDQVLAALGLAIVPVLVLYLIFSRQLIRGITAGAVK